MLFRALIVCVLLTSSLLAAPKAEHVILVTLDGLRTQEFFGGADKSLINSEYGGVRNVGTLTKDYWRETPQERREILLPFIWQTIAKQGQIFGDREKESPVNITNRLYFSYPGYNELLAGFADPKIDSNNKKNNENKTVLEYLNALDRFKGRVEAYTCWDVFPFIINTQRSGIPVMAAQDAPYAKPKDDRQKLINEMAKQVPTVWAGVCFDAFCQYPAIDALREGRVSVLYVSFGETDEWAHGKRYDCYLEAASRADRYIKELWETVQSLPKYKDKTALIITTDHGRGDNQANWINHGNKAKTSEFAWIAVLGPDTPALGVREKILTTQSQVAATVAALVGEDFTKVDERVAKPLADVVK